MSERNRDRQSCLCHWLLQRWMAGARELYHMTCSLPSCQPISEASKYHRSVQGSSGTNFLMNFSSDFHPKTSSFSCPSAESWNWVQWGAVLVHPPPPPSSNPCQIFDNPRSAHWDGSTTFLCDFARIAFRRHPPTFFSCSASVIKPIGLWRTFKPPDPPSAHFCCFCAACPRR